MSRMVAVIARVRAKPDMARSFETLVTGVAANVEAVEQGNVFYRAYRTRDPQVFVAIEVYRDKSAQQAHLASAHRAAAASRVMALLEGGIEAEVLEQVW